MESHNKVEKEILFLFLSHMYIVVVCRDGSMYVMEHVEVREQLWSWFFPYPSFVCPGYFSCCYDKHHDQHQVVEDRVYLADRSLSISEGSQGRDSR